MRRRLSVAFLLAMCGAALPLAQQNQTSPPTFRTGIDVIQVDLRVVDSTGRFVRGLTKDDFRIFEDDKEQAVSSFSFVDLALPAASPTPTKGLPRADVASNAGSDGRLYVMVLAGLSAHVRPVVQELAREFVENHLSPADQVAIVPLNGTRNTIQEFTHDRGVLLESIDRFDPSVGVSGDIALTIISLIDWVSQIQGRRKAMVFVTEDVNDIIGPPVIADGTLDSIRFPMDLDKLLNSAARANVSLYIVDPTGVPTGPQGKIKVLPRDLDVASRQSASRPPLTALGGDADRRMGLRDLAEATGGEAFGTTSNDFVGAFDKIVEANSSYYLLGYTSTNTKQDGRFRKTRVEVNRPRLKVMARSGYLPDRPTAADSAPRTDGLSDDLATLLKSPIALSGLTLQVSAVPFRGQGRSASVGIVVEASGPDLRFENVQNRFNGGMELAVVATDENGEIVSGERGSLTMRLLATTHENVAANGIRFFSTLELLPGRYHLKVAATDKTGGQTRGLVQHDVTVPDFRGPVTMSGIALASAQGTQMTAHGVADLWTPLGLPPTTLREFTAADELGAYVEVYTSIAAAASASTTVVTTVRSAAGRTVFSNNRRLPPSLSNTVHQVVTTIPLRGMAAGDYVLAVEARSSTAPAQPALQQIPFRVR